MAKTNLTTFFENGLLAPFLNTVKHQTTQDRPTRLYKELEEIYVSNQAYSTNIQSDTNIIIYNLLNHQPRFKELRKPRNGKSIQYPVARYITDTFPSLLDISESDADHIYRNEFEYIVHQLLKGPPRNNVGSKRYFTTYGWDEAFEEKLPQNFIVDEPPNPLNMKIFAFKRKLVEYKDQAKPSGPKLWKIE